MIMELEEIKEIWNSQNSQSLYTINEQVMNHQIQIKRKKALHISNFSEILLIGVNVGSGMLIILLNDAKPRTNFFMYALAGWMLITAAYTLATRMNRMKRDKIFDRSVRGDLDHAISTARHQVQLSKLMRWNIIPIGSLVILATWDGGKSLWLAAAVTVFFALTFYFGGWEHNIYVNRKAELEALKEKLLQDEQLL